VTAGVHEHIPRFSEPQPPEVMMPMPPGSPGTLTTSGLANPAEEATASSVDQRSTRETPLVTEADALLERYRALGSAQQHRYGEGDLQTPPPDFNLGLPTAANLVRPSSGRENSGTTSAGTSAGQPGVRPQEETSPESATATREGDGNGAVRPE